MTKLDTFTKAERATINDAFSLIEGGVRACSTSIFSEWVAASKDFNRAHHGSLRQKIWMIEGYAKGCLDGPPMRAPELMSCDKAFRMGYMVGAYLNDGTSDKRHYIVSNVRSLAQDVDAAKQAELARYTAARYAAPSC